MRVTINGELQDLAGPLSVSGLLSFLHLPETKIAVERNLEIVPKSLFDSLMLEEGDQLEIVQFVGGG